MNTRDRKLKALELRRKARDLREEAEELEQEIARLRVAEDLDTRNVTLVIAVTRRDYDEYGDLVKTTYADSVSSGYQVRILNTDDIPGLESLLEDRKVIHGTSNKVGEALLEMLTKDIE